MNTVNQDSSTVKIHPAFELKRSREVNTLNLTVYEFEHRNTGAMHYHLSMPHQENVFMVALRTVPMDSKGVAHILEHTALCGSERFPVRDPFFLMIRRSLNTFMNAFTTSDYTAYPFASQNRQDFFNLLDIYLDAVFFARLHPLDFAQEGHRLEFEVPDDPGTELVYRGIVFNEMKGDESSVISVLIDSVKEHLFPTTTYHFNSGGDPKHIPELTYEELLDFYKSHYHPSNAIFMTFGDMSAYELQSEFEAKALSRFSRSALSIEVGKEKRLNDMVREAEPYAVDDIGDLDNKTHIVVAWLLGPNTDLEMLIKCNLLSDVLLDTSASPLRHALEKTSLGGAPSPLCGLEESNREMSFLCGVEGSEKRHADEVEQLIFSTLRQIAEKGVEKEKLEACLHQIELSSREIGGDGQPFGLQLIFSCMSAAIHRGDPIDLLDLDPVLKKLRREIDRPEFIQELIKDLLLDNKHCIRLSLFPDTQLNQENQAAERSKLRAIKASLSQAETDKIVQLAKNLQDRQGQEEPVDVLPKVGLDDIPLNLDVPVGNHRRLSNNMPLTQYEAGTNGLVYHQITCEMPELAVEELNLLPLFTFITTELGSAGRSYLDTQHILHSVCGGINAFSAIRGSIDDPNRLQAQVTYSSRALVRNSFAMMDALKQCLLEPNFKEVARIRDLVKQVRIRRDASITGNGHSLVMSAAAAYFRPVSLLNHYLSGLASIRNLKKLDDEIEDPSNLQGLIDTLSELLRLLRKTPRQLLLINEAETTTGTLSLLHDCWQESVSETKPLQLDSPFDATPKDQAWLTTTQVNFCATAFQTVPESHADSAALSVLAGVLRNGYLHRTIREKGGAYGGGATHDAASGIFRFYSYRDPNLMATFEAFDESIKWILASDISFDLIEESILGIISSIDAPGSPAGEARQAFHNALFGRTAAHRKTMRRNILGVTVADVKQVANEYLLANSSRAVITSESNSVELLDSFVVTQI